MIDKIRSFLSEKLTFQKKIYKEIRKTGCLI
jgi:hypothetical protein